MKMLRQLFQRLCLAPLVCFAATDLKPYPVMRTVETAGHAEQLSAVQLPAETFHHLNEQRDNIRFVDESGYAIPYRVQPQADRRAVITKHPIGCRIGTLSISDDNRIQLIVTRKTTDTPVHGMTIHTNLRDFEHTVQIDSRPSSTAEWTPLVDKGIIFDYSRFADVRHNRIDFPATDHLEFRVRIDQAVTNRPSQSFETIDRSRKTGGDGFDQTRRTIRETPFRVTRIQLWQTVKKVVPNNYHVQAYPPQSNQSEIDEKTGDSIVTLEMSKEPISSVRFVTDALNFSRTARIAMEVQTHLGPEWREIGVTRLFSIGKGPHRQESLKLSFSECMPIRLRINIENGELAPLTFSEIAPRGITYEAQLIPPASDQIAMYYGGAPEAITTDVSAIAQLFTSGEIPKELTLGPEQANPNHGTQSDWAGMLGHPAFFGVAITAVILVLAWALFHAAKQLPEADAPRESPTS